MRHVDDREWALLKKSSASHLTDPNWLGGGFCVTDTNVSARVLLPVGPWDAVVLARSLPTHTP
jgi:hypothetical protein